MQYINRALVICYGVAVALGLAGYLSSLISAPDKLSKVVMWVCACVLPFIVCAAVYMKNKESKSVQYFMSFGYMLFYLNSILSETRYIYIYVYIFPVLIILIACNNIKLIYAIGGITVGLNLYDTFSSWSVVTRPENLSRLAMVGICAAFAVFAAKVSEKLTNQKLSIIEDEQKATDEITLKMSDYIEGLNSNKEELSQAISGTATVVAGINEGMNNAVSSITQQLEATENIKRLVGEAKEQVFTMDGLIQNTDSSIASGSSQINELLQSTDTMRLKNDTILNEAGELSTKAEQVRNIVGIINSIASQTKLLSLNASIEAARAGEQGRGFAVVAEEINCLSAQTADFIKQITEIIDTLSGEIGAMKSAVDDMVNANELQNSVIAKVEESFSSIRSCMSEVKDDMSTLTHRIDNVSSHTDSIVESAANVSAVSEEVLASTNEADQICDKNTEIVGTISEIANSLQESAENLKSRR